jgi:glycosyltransferase involved in cell wall biosynthesis
VTLQAATSAAGDVGQVPWPLRWIVDEHGRDTGFAMLRRGIEPSQRQAYEAVAAGHRMIGFTHYGPFPLYHPAYDGQALGREPRAGWTRQEVLACEAWAHCFRDPDNYLPQGPPRLLLSGSDFVHDRAAWRAAHGAGPPAKRWDLVYSCLPTWLSELQKNWDLARACALRLADAGARIVMVGRAGAPGLPRHRNIDCLPQLSWTDFVRVTASAKIAFVPNCLDASPRVITEALAVDVPVLVNRRIIGGWKYLAKETGRFFTDEGDVVEEFFRLMDSEVFPRDWLIVNGYGQQASAERLATELRALGGNVAADLGYALPTDLRPASR